MIRNRIKHFGVIWSMLLLVLLSGYQVQAQFVASAALDSTHMMIGDQMKLRFSIQAPANTQISSINYSALEKDENVELLNNGNFDTLSQGNLTIFQKDLLFSVYDSGTFWVPAIQVKYQQGSVSKTATTNRIPIEVMTPVQDSVYLAPIKPIIKEALTLRDAIPYVVTVLLLILLVGSILYFVNRKGKEEAPPPPPRLVPAHDIANEKLVDLRNKKLWQNGEVKAYQSELTYIVREYLENRYGAQALESTTSEILDQLKALDFDDEMKSQLREMLELADMVKFAKAEPPVEAHDRLMNYANSFVDKTKPPLTEEGYKEGLVELPPE